MAFTGITATEAQIDQKAGANVDTNFTDTMKTQSLLFAESILNAMTRYNWSDWYTTGPNVDIKHIITDTTASMVAIDAINYNKNGYLSVNYANSLIAVLNENVMRNLSILRNTNTQTFMFGE